MKAKKFNFVLLDFLMQLGGAAPIRYLVLFQLLKPLSADRNNQAILTSWRCMTLPAKAYFVHSRNLGIATALAINFAERWSTAAALGKPVNRVSSPSLP